MRKKPLNALYGSYVARSRSLMSRSLAGLPADPAEMAICEPVHLDSLLFLVVRLQHLWGEFCRELVVRSAIGGCVTRTGAYVPPAPDANHVRDLPAITGQFTKQPFTGPRSQWEVPSFAIDQARFLRVANYGRISLALSAVSVIDYLKPIRNFIVHPNARTSASYNQAARGLGFPGFSPVQLLNQRQPGGATIFGVWISQLEAAAWNAVA